MAGHLFDVDRKYRDAAEVPAAHWRCVEFQLRTIDQTNTIDKTVVVGV